MVIHRLASALLFAALPFAPAGAQSVQVLAIAGTENYQAVHYSNEHDLNLSLAGAAREHKKIYVRVFLDPKDVLLAQADRTPPGQCVHYTHLLRMPVNTGDHANLDAVLRTFNGSTETVKDYTLVFEEGDEDLRSDLELKLDPAKAADYFHYALPLRLIATGEEKQAMLARTRPPRQPFFSQVLAIFVMPAFANPPVPHTPRSTSTDSPAPQPCQALDKPLPDPGTPHYEYSALPPSPAAGVLATLLPPVLVLKAKPCAG